jgi:hypothetical protein
MRTHYVADTPIDDDRLAKDLDLCNSFRWSEAYSDYVSGGAYKSCMLWTPGGETGDGEVSRYDHGLPGAFTQYGNELTYVRELVSEVADLDRLNFVRLAKVQHSVGLPHRDLLELGDVPNDTRNAHRAHIPLVTDEECFFTERNTVYRMRKGEIWFLDATEIHSVAVLSAVARIHLMLDFVDAPSATPLVSIAGRSAGDGIPGDRVVTRPPLPDADRAALLQLADVMTTDTINDIFSIVGKKHHRYDGGGDFVWDTMVDIARAAADPALLPHIEELRRYFTIERAPSE